jgi:cytochrome c-type biogenesis protein CcmF
MCIAHLGVGVFIVGATVASAYNFETDVAARPGDRLQAAGYEVVFRDLRRVEGPNYVAERGEFEVRKNDRLVTVLTSEQRVYQVQSNPMTEAGIDARIARDVFVALGEPLGAGAWSVRLQVKPLIRLIWLGALIMAFGGLLAITDRRYRQPVRERSAAANAPTTPVERRA